MIIVTTFLKCTGVIVLIAVLYSLIITFTPGFSVFHRLPKNIDSSMVKKDDSIHQWRKDVHFEVEGTAISAWLYLPENFSKPAPCIVMANGLGGTKDMLLESYANRFRKSGLAVLTFDYRFFGKSGGEPRQLIWMPHQLKDLETAISYARNRKEIDPARVALWGTSAGGGHVITIAARDSNIACVSAMVPMLDGKVAIKNSTGEESSWLSFRMFLHAQRDMFRYRFGLPPHRIPIINKSGTIGLMTSADAYEDFGKLLPDNYVNQACARIILRTSSYRPVETAQNIQCPVLLQISENDSIIPK
ncbi:MAG: prolyl oligopeptidase family serine peptidase, partial [Desulfobacteraceae bacterium]|nr:prolyl oligopeptidase family serine peptidase [Desulfobacteraceae bacterium]